MVLIIFISIGLIIVALIIFLCVSTRMSKRESRAYLKEFNERHAKKRDRYVNPA